MLAAQKIVSLYISNDSTKSKHKTLADEKRQTVETLLANAKKIDEFLATNERRMGKGKRLKEVQSNITDDQSAKRTTRKYRHRMWTIEPVFGNITSNKRLNRLSLRGEKKCTAQWLMFCLVHNIEKLLKNANDGDWLTV